jgi:hypothetical protein
MLSKKEGVSYISQVSRDLVMESRVIRYSRDLAIALKAADAALKGVQAAAVRVTRGLHAL